jgi:type IV pilus assembly protein PilY1
VGGFNSGGRGYYALDVTDPATPIALWEFTTAQDPDIGYSYGNPIVTKDNAVPANWVVLLTSGYNNIGPGDGGGHLYVLDVATGALTRKIDTGVGTVANPSGFARISGFSDDPNANNQVLDVYGGDLQGNLWRIDFNAASNQVSKIAVLSDNTVTTQPITTRPELALVGTTRMIMVATGKFIEPSDKSTTQTQTVYGILDQFDTLGTLTDPHNSASGLTQQSLSPTADLVTADGTPARSLTGNSLSLSGGRGWLVDLSINGERATVDPVLTQGVLKVASNVPLSGLCTTGGQSWIDFLDFKTGGATNTSGIGSIFAGNALIVGMVVQVLTSGVEVINVTKSDNPTPETLPGNPGNPAGGGIVQGRRSSWRELVQ